MERQKYPLIILILCISQNIAGESYRDTIYQAYINNRMMTWKAALDSMHARPASTHEDRLEQLNYLYGYIAWCLGNKKQSEAQKYLQQAYAILNDLENKNYFPSYLHAYRSAFIGYEIGISWYKAPFIGNQSLLFARKSIAEDSLNPLGYIQYANAYFYMPAIFGGSVDSALIYYLKAETLMEKNPVWHIRNWNYLSLLVSIAQAYTQNENYEQARAYYERIIKFEPGFLWVKNELYPKLLRRYHER